MYASSASCVTTSNVTSKGCKLPEKVTEAGQRVMASQRYKTYDEMLQFLGIFALRRRRTGRDPIKKGNILVGPSGIKREMFTTVPDRSTRRHSLRLHRDHQRPQMRAGFFTDNVIPLLSRLQLTLIMSKD